MKIGADVTEGHGVSDKTLLDLFVLLGFSDESHLLWLTAVEVHIKEKPSTDKCLFLSNEREAGEPEQMHRQPKAFTNVDESSC